MRDETHEELRPLRTGLTTGSCATACSVAAAHLLLGHKKLSTISITLPKGKMVELPICDSKLQGDSALAATIKDAGDDPDVTHGARLWVSIRLQDTGIMLKAGKGVGTVTRTGLVLEVGAPAINPVPQKMITEHLQQLAQEYDYSGGFEVIIGVDNGEALALKTMNPRLGILGGLSILGTTGIVRPFSCAAYIASIHQGIDVARSNGYQHIAASTGNTSEAFIAQHYGLPEIALIEMGDFAGAVLKYVKKHPVAKLSVCAGFGKLTKLAQGHLDLHSRASSVDFAWLAQLAAEQGAGKELCAKIMGANTSLEARKLALAQGVDLTQSICEAALAKVRSIVPKSVQAEVWAVDRKGACLGMAGSDILVLGGTSLALKLTRKLLAQGYSVIYSIAGLVRQPDLPCKVISGGFTQFGGMVSFIQTQQISLIIDATHPYAAQISQHAVVAAQACGLPCWRLQRPAWLPVNGDNYGDNWSEFADWEGLLPALNEYKRVFLSQGHLSAEQLAQLAAQRQPGQRFYLRTAVSSALGLPDWVEPLQATGPFQYADELALFRQLGIDVLVSKNSGGEMTAAKLAAARELDLPVLFLRRPELPPVGAEFFDIAALLGELSGG